MTIFCEDIFLPVRTIPMSYVLVTYRYIEYENYVSHNNTSLCYDIHNFTKGLMMLFEMAWLLYSIEFL